jgi:5-formyltetrahydrofolate cyclo-ligase
MTAVYPLKVSDSQHYALRNPIIKRKTKHGKHLMHRTKHELREALKKEWFAIPLVEREKKSSGICSCLLDILDGCSPVMVYVSKPPEVSTETLIAAFIARGGRVIVPIIERETVSFRLSYLDDPSVLVDSTFHVPEPVGGEIPARPEEVTVAVIPVLGFDWNGNRLGYGSGYYDQFLAQHPDITTIDLAFACQETSAIPCDAHDVRMDMVITENGICRCGGNTKPDSGNLQCTLNTIK